MSWQMIGALAAVVAFLTTVATEPVLIRLLIRVGMFDVPNSRSSHERPTPRGGGLGVALGIVGGSTMVAHFGGSLPPLWLLAATTMVGLTGLADDILGGLPPWLRLAVQVSAASIVLVAFGPLERLALPAPANLPLGWVAWPLSVIWLVGVTNIFNFLDGIDGFAGTQALIGGAAMGLALRGSVAGHVGWLVAGAGAGFLIFNWHPARVFMGDVGSATLGFLFAASPWLLPEGARPAGVWLVGMALWFFLADGAWTILRRAARREKVWQAHREHLYQRLVKAGWSHSRVVACVAPPAAGLALAAVRAYSCPQPGPSWGVTGAAVLLFAGYVALVARVERRQRAWGPSGRLDGGRGDEVVGGTEGQGGM